MKNCPFSSLEPLPSEAEPEHYVSSEPTGATLWAWHYHQSLAKQVKDAFADPNQTLAAQLCLISKTSPLLAFALDKALGSIMT